MRYTKFVGCSLAAEGRYAPSTGLVGLTIVFRSDDGTLDTPLGELKKKSS